MNLIHDRIVDYMVGMTQYVKWPKLRLPLGEDERSIVLKLAGSQSRFPGSVAITSPGDYDSATFYGRLSSDGRWYAKCPDATTLLIHAALTQFEDDPQGTAKLYGQLFNECCFCSRELTHPASVAAGYGPICARRHGLPWGDGDTATNATHLQNEMAALMATPVAPIIDKCAHEQGIAHRTDITVRHITAWLQDPNDNRDISQLAFDIDQEQHS